MKQFDFYQIAGVIAPGIVVIAGGALLFLPEKGNLELFTNLSVGSFGLSLILSYAVGQLLQTIGNAVEWVFWKLCGGMPTDWVRTGKKQLIDTAQLVLLQKRVKLILNDSKFSFNATTEKSWYAVTRQIYAAVSSSKRSARIDVFNGNYGLCRGIAAGFIVLFVGMVVTVQSWELLIITLFLITLAIYRMHRFGVNYGRELFVQFLQIPDELLKGGKQ